MPIFDYRCPACLHEFDKLVRLVDKPPVCPECGQPTIQIWSRPAPAQWACSKGSL